MNITPTRCKRVLVLLVACCALFPLFGSGSLAQGPGEELVILRPQVHDILIGPAEVVLLVKGIPDAEIRRALVSINGMPQATITGAPWRATVDTGDSVGSKTVTARVLLRDGRELSTSLTTKPAGLNSVDVRLINLAVTVVDRKGKPARNLKRDDFEVYDGGVKIEFTRWDNDPSTLAVALVVDTSLTMEGKKLEAAKSAARTFVRALAEQDLVSVVSFNESSIVQSPLSAEHDRAYDTIGTLQPGGGTALYDAVFDAAKHLAEAPPLARKIAVILSDGRDESASGLEPGSFHTLKEAIVEGHRSDLLLFTIGLGAGLEEQPDYTGRMTTAEVLQRMADSTGGRFFRVRRFSKLSRAYRDILEELRTQYHIAYPPPEHLAGETWREVKVLVTKPGLEVRTREGYFIR